MFHRKHTWQARSGLYRGKVAKHYHMTPDDAQAQAQARARSKAQLNREINRMAGYMLLRSLFNGFRFW